MAAVRMRFRAELRTKWKGMLGVALRVGLAAGTVFAAAAGARRTDTALARVVRAQRVADVLINPDGSDNSATFRREWEAVDRLQGIVAVGTVDGVAVAPVDTQGEPDVSAMRGEVDLAAEDTESLRTIERPHLLAGRLPRPERSDEILVNDAKARHSHLSVGA